MTTCELINVIQPDLAAHDLHFGFRDRMVFQGASLQVRAGEVVSLLGANGSGKSTLLRLVMGFLTPSQGRVELAGRLVSSLRRREVARRLAYVPQAHSSPFPYTVREIALLGRLPHRGLTRVPNREDGAVVDDVLERLGIGHLAHRPYTEISGGERQLTLIGRAIAQGASTLVLDEPVSGLDYGNQVRLLARLRDLARTGYAVLKTTHHPDHALAGSDRVVLLQDGRITAAGAPADVLTAGNISALYGVTVEMLHDTKGRAAGFRPI